VGRRLRELLGGADRDADGADGDADGADGDADGARPDADGPDADGPDADGPDADGPEHSHDTAQDPDRLMLGTPHGEELAVVPWPILIREKVHRRARSSDRYRWWVLAVVLAGLLSSNVLFTVFVVALPSVASGLHTSVSTITWVVTAPMLAVAVSVPLAGKLSDRFGHRRFFLIGMTGNVAVAVLSALSPDAGALIAARALGGVVGAGLGASSMALVLSMFDSGDRVKAMGWWSMVGAGGPVLGVAVGGFIIESIGWRAMFVLEMALGGVALVLAAMVLPEHGFGQRRVHTDARTEAHTEAHTDAHPAAHTDAHPAAHTEAHTARMPPLDIWGAVLVVASVGSLLFGLNRAPVVGFSGPLVIGSFCVAVVAGVALFMVERRAADPLVPFRYLRRRNFILPLGAQALAQFAYMGAFFLTPLMLEQVYRYGESTSGLLVIPRPLSFAVLAPVAGYVAVKVGERTTAVLGTFAVVASMVCYSLTASSHGVALVEIALVLSGFGMGVASPSISASIANVVDQDALGTASAMQQLVVQIATVAGIQVFQTVQESTVGVGRSQLLGSFHIAFIAGGCVAIVGVIFAVGLHSTVRTEPAGVAAQPAHTPG
jgi:MFS family permease